MTAVWNPQGQEPVGPRNPAALGGRPSLQKSSRRLAEDMEKGGRETEKKNGLLGSQEEGWDTRCATIPGDYALGR